MKLLHSSAICFLLAQAALVANPQSPTVISGDASFEIRSPEVLEIVASDRSIIEWADFSIDSGETTRFIQPNGSSSVLNRVILDNPSRLMGQLESNGQVLLINPNGILVGNQAQINTGSFIASSLDINQEMFLAKGKLQFDGDSEAFVQNEGTIQAEGDLFLIGPYVENAGSMQSQGKAGLLATRAVSIGGDKEVYVQTRWEETDLDNPFAGAFKTEESPTYARQAGVLSGGDLFVLGDLIRLDSGSLTDASGPAQGGNILIGGDFQGNNPLILNSKQVWTSSGAVLNASAKISGNAGRIITWADEQNLFYGSILAEGGFENGDGGFVEVSSPGFLDFKGTVTALAPQGNIGKLLLDPAGVTISAGDVNWNPVCVPGFIGNPAVVNIDVGNLLTALTACSVTVNTAASAGAGTGDITVAAPIAYVGTETGTLTLMASNGITVNAGSTITLAAATTGNLILSAAGGIGGPIDLNDAIINNSTTSSVTINQTGTGAININGNITYAATSTGSLTITAKEAITSFDAITFAAGSTGNIMGTAAGNISLQGPISYASSSANGVSLNSTGGTFSNTAGGTITFNAGATGPLAIAATAITIGGHITVNTTSNTTLTSTGNIAINNQVQNTAAAPGGNMTMIAPNAGTITFGAGTTSYFGSLNGTTIIGDPTLARCARSRPTVTMGLESILGFNLTAAFNNAAGPIDVTCGTLTLTGAEIGHEAAQLVGLVAFTTNAATITVDANGPITVQATTFSSQIGHGGIESQNGSMLLGDVAVSTSFGAVGTAGITIENIHVLPANNKPAAIGHYIANGALASGDVTVQSAGDINITTSQANGACTIGHLTLGNATGNVVVLTNGNLNITTNNSGDAFIGHNAFAGSVVNETSNCFVSVKGSVTIDANSTGPLQIGSRSTGTLTNGLLEMLIGGSFTINPNSGSLNNSVIIGFTSANFPTTADTNIAIGGSLSITQSAAGQPVQITAPHDVNLSVFGNIDASGTGLVPLLATELSFISAAHVTGSTRVNAGGHIRANPGTAPAAPATNYFLIGFPGPSPVLNSVNTNLTLPPLFTTGSLIVQAGQDLQLLNGFQTQTGTIAIGSGISFQAGELWTIANNQLATIGVQYPPSCPPRGLFTAVNQMTFPCAASCLLNNAPPPPCACPAACSSGNPCPGLCEFAAIALANSTAIGGSCTCLSMNSGVNFNSAILESTMGGPIFLFSNTCTVCAPCAAVGAGGLIIGTPTTFPGSTNTLVINPTAPAIAGDVTISQFPNIALNLYTPALNFDTANLTFSGCTNVSTANPIVANGTVEISSQGSATIASTILNNGAGPIVITADSKSTGTGDLNVTASITSSGGNICLYAGPGTFSCPNNSAATSCLFPFVCNCTLNNFVAGMIPGIPVGTNAINITGAGVTVNAAGGAVNGVAAGSITVNGANPSITTTGAVTLTVGQGTKNAATGNITINQPVVGSTVFTFAGKNTTLTPQVLVPINLINASGAVGMLSGVNLSLNGTAVINSTSGPVTLVVDNNFPASPLIGPGFLSLSNQSQINSGAGAIRIFTARQSLNQLNAFGALFNGLSLLSFAALGFESTDPFPNTAFEQACTYFSPTFTAFGTPFTFFYKNCMQQAAQQAQIIVSQLGLDLHPYNEFPGWEEDFTLSYRPARGTTRFSSLNVLPKEGYMLRRRHFNILNQPKSWTQLLPE